MHEAQYWEAQRDGTVRCLLCPHHCVRGDGGAGLCCARMNHGGQLVSLNYGRVSALSMDPVEKKPLKRFMPGTMTLSAGSFGCNLACPYCQNHEIAQDTPETEYVPPDQMVSIAKREGAPTVSFTYNEPLVGYEWVLDAARYAQGQGIGVILVTNGYVEDAPLRALLPYVSAMNIDLKAFTEDTYRRIGGSLKPVMRTIEAAAAACHVEVTCLLVTGMHTGEELGAMFDWLASVDPQIPLHLSRYFPRYLCREPATDPEWMRRMEALAREKLSYVYLGNL